MCYCRLGVVAGLVTRSVAHQDLLPDLFPIKNPRIKPQVTKDQISHLPSESYPPPEKWIEIFQQRPGSHFVEKRPLLEYFSKQITISTFSLMLNLVLSFNFKLFRFLQNLKFKKLKALGSIIKSLVQSASCVCFSPETGSPFTQGSLTHPGNDFKFPISISSNSENPSFFIYILMYFIQSERKARRPERPDIKSEGLVMLTLLQFQHSS